MNVCRTCAEESSADLVPIFSKLNDKFIANVIVDCSAISINEDDGLPAFVCTSCMVTIKQIISFGNQVRESDRKLRLHFKLETSAEKIKLSDQEHKDSAFLAVPVEVDIKLEVEDEDALGQSFPDTELSMQKSEQESDDSEEADDSSKSSDEESVQDVKVTRRTRQKTVAVASSDSEDERPKRAKRQVGSAKEDSNELHDKPKRRRGRKPQSTFVDVSDDGINSELDEVEQEIYTLVQADKGRVFCCLCYKDFASRSELVEHGTQKHSKKTRKVNYSKKYACDVCYCRYVTEDALEEHKSVAAKLHTRKIYECSRCSNRFATVKRRRLHAHNHPVYNEQKEPDLEEQKERLVTCCMKTCNKMFPTKEELLEHGKKEHLDNKALVKIPSRPHECPVCYKTFERLESLKRHRYRIFMQSVQCSICGKQFKNRNALYNHERNHNSDKSHACEICGKRFMMITQLKNHYAVHSDEKPFVCKECGWSFKRECTLKKHMLQHSDVLPWKCEVCGKCFKMNICRTCAEDHNEELVPIFSKLDGRFIANVIVNCSDISITEDDGLPSGVCASCMVTVKQIISFATQVRESDRKLRTLLSAEAPSALQQECGESNFITVPLEAVIKLEVEDDDALFENIHKKEIDALESGQESDGFDKDNDSDWKWGGNSSVENRVEGRVTRRSRRKTASTVVELDSEKDNPKHSSRRDRQKASDNDDLALESSDSEPLRRRNRRSQQELVEEDDEDCINSELDEIEQEIYTLVKTETDRHYCCLCYKDFGSRDELVDHGQQKHSKKTRKINYSKKYACDVCYCRYISKDALAEHQAIASKLHTKKIYECSRCSNRFATIKRRRMHAHNHPKYNETPDPDLEEQKERPVTCCMKTCNKMFPTKEELFEHSKKEHLSNKPSMKNPSRPHECPVCFKTFEKLQSLKRHRYRIFMTSMQCSICGKQFKNRNALYTHERKHNSDKAHACEVCGKRFMLLTQLKNHYAVHNDEKPFVCKECGWSFKRNCNLKHHMLQHSNSLPWKCEVCGKCFKGKYHLQYHMRIHTGHKPWQCRYCEKSFADHANRARHETSHTGIKPYKCTYCDKTFIRRRFQIEHESTHTGIKPYRCERCKLTFSQKSALKKHLEIHPLAPENLLSLAQPSPMPPMEAPDGPMSPPAPSATAISSSTMEPPPSGVPFHQQM